MGYPKGNNLDAIISVGYRVNSIRATHLPLQSSSEGYCCLSEGFGCTS